jgi:hypothetical protein
MKIKLSEEAKQAAHETLPEHMAQSVIDYFEQGYSPGDFFRAVLENDLVGAVSHADEINKHALPQYVQWLYWHPPGRPNGWGSHEAVQRHLLECYEQNEKGEEAA